MEEGEEEKAEDRCSWSGVCTGRHAVTSLVIVTRLPQLSCPITQGSPPLREKTEARPGSMFCQGRPPASTEPASDSGRAPNSGAKAHCTERTQSSPTVRDPGCQCVRGGAAEEVVTEAWHTSVTSQSPVEPDPSRGRAAWRTLSEPAGQPP